MLLKALQSHSQISHHVETSHSTEETVTKIKSDGYLGLYVPTNRLLDALGTNASPVHEPYVRLFVAYAWEALRAGRHLSELGPGLVAPGYWRNIGRAVTAYVEGIDELEDSVTEMSLESSLFGVLVSLDRGEVRYTLGASPSVAFPQLAEAARQMSDVWSDATILYLLDDVSTRNLSRDDIGRLLGTLLFAHPHCAFKMTTEVQTMELLLKSPGLIETARVGRDYDTFDLATKVVDRLTDGNGVEFVERILESRSHIYPRHPPLSPRQLLGEEKLEDIARSIATAGESARQKKAVYRGINALTALCVGDIGDILKIYESIITHYDSSSPISFERQSGEFQQYCSKQLYHLNRRKGELKDFALSFAQAAHRLLVKSAQSSGAGKRRELRQYTQLYVRVTTGNMDWQFEKLRELIDAGVFVLRRGPDVPRTKTRDSNPTHHFILTYRKLYGVSSYIGLSNRDRFELSGDDLIAWLENPADGADILGRNLGLIGDGESEAGDSRGRADERVHRVDDSSGNQDGRRMVENRQLAMVLGADSEPTMRSLQIGPFGTLDNGDYLPSSSNMPEVMEISNIDDVKHAKVVITSLGFEDRAVVSAERVLSVARPE